MQTTLYHSVFDTRLERGNQSITDFWTTENGYRFSTSVGGGLTGVGGGLLIVDDAIKADDAASDRLRTKVNDWFDSTVWSRLNKSADAIIIVMQRLHVDDLIAHVQRRGDWEILSFPAIAQETRTFGFQTSFGWREITINEGELLHPDLLSEQRLDELRQNLTPYRFSAQYLQNPEPPAGNIIQRDWLRYYSPKLCPEKFDAVLLSWDTAHTEAEFSSFSVGTVWGLKNGIAYLLCVYRRKLNFPALKSAVREIATRYQKLGPMTILIENKASGISLYQELNTEGKFTIVLTSPGSDSKEMRLNAQASKFESGRVLLPEEAYWKDDYVSELTSYPSTRFDDQVDSTSQALEWIGKHFLTPSITTYLKALGKPANDDDFEFVFLKGPPGVTCIDTRVAPGERLPFGFQGSRPVGIGPDGFFKLTLEEARAYLRTRGWTKVAKAS